MGGRLVPRQRPPFAEEDILEALGSKPRPMSQSEILAWIAEHRDNFLPYNYTREKLKRMVQAGKIVRVRPGVYRLKR